MILSISGAFFPVFWTISDLWTEVSTFSAGDTFQGKFTWKIEHFTKLKELLKKRKITGLCIKSRRFQVGSRDCRLIVYPRGEIPELIFTVSLKSWFRLLPKSKGLWTRDRHNAYYLCINSLPLVSSLFFGT